MSHSPPLITTHGYFISHQTFITDFGKSYKIPNNYPLTHGCFITIDLKNNNKCLRVLFPN